MASPELEPQPQETVLKPELFGRQFKIPLHSDEFSRFREKLMKMDAGRALEIALFFGLIGLALEIYLRNHAKRNGIPAEELIPVNEVLQESFANFWSKTYRSAMGFVVNTIGMVRQEYADDIVSDTYFNWFKNHWGRGGNYDAKPDNERKDMWIKSLINRAANWRRDHFRRKDVSLETLMNKYNWDIGETVEDEIIEQLSPDEETEELHHAIADFLEKSDRRRQIVAFLNTHKLPHQDIAEILGITAGASKAIWFRVCLGLRQATGRHREKTSS